VINNAQIAIVVAQIIHTFGLAAGGVLGASVGLPIRRAIIRKWAR
jgi:hypothetical protein